MGDFEIEAVLNFMLSKGGRVRNTDLVTHFKNFLNHPNKKAYNREKFKDYVNELATIKLDSGEKVLVLKKKYRPGSEGKSLPAPGPPPPLTGAASAPKIARIPQHGKQESPGPSSDTASAAEAPRDTKPVATPRETKSRAPQPPQDSPRAKSEPPNEPAKRQEGHEGARAFQEDLRADEAQQAGRLAKARSDDGLEMKQQSQAEGQSSQGQGLRADDNTSASGSFLSLSSAASQESVGSSTSGIGSLDDDPNASVMSVMDKVKKLNKIQSDTDVSLKKHGGTKKQKYYTTGDDDESTHSSAMSYVTLTPEEKDWMVICSTADYHEMNRLLSKSPGLAKLKDLTNTALHWAAKRGKPEVIKLVANKHGVHVDQRSGYTPLHLAAIHGHETIIELLVQTFKADPNLRDYSGKKAKQYLKNSASSKAQQLLVSRRLGSAELNSLRASDDSFTRANAVRMSSRTKALLQHKSSAVPLLRSSWAGDIENLEEKEENQEPRNFLAVPDQSPVPLRRKNTPRDFEMMPPPPTASSMRIRRIRYSDRSKSSSRESINSPSRNNQYNGNGMARSESDPILLEGSLV